MITITCKCGHTEEMEAFYTRPVSGELPAGTFQCPKCNLAFKKKHGKPTYYENGYVSPGPLTLIKVDPVL